LIFLGATTVSAHNDTAFLRMFIMILGALVAFTVIILILANQIIGSVEEERGEDPRMRAMVLERIKPVGTVNVAAADAAPAAPMSGAEVVAAACNSCHVAGVLEAPKIGDKAAWSQRMAAAGGVDGLTASAIKGKGGMPPKGGAMVSDGEIRAAVEEMLSKSGVDASAAAPAPAGPAAAVKEMAADAADAAKSMVAAVMPAPPPALAPAPVPEAAPAEQSAAPAADLAKGKAVYGAACFVCHTTGAAGAPKLGDKALWAPRIAQGMETLQTNALRGKGAMPPKGGRMDIPDADVVAAVAYMVSESE
jgi:cytochrome c5